MTQATVERVKALARYRGTHGIGGRTTGSGQILFDGGVGRSYNPRGDSEEGVMTVEICRHAGYGLPMTTLKVTVDENDLKAARSVAAQQRMTLDRLVGDFLASLARRWRPSTPDDLSEDQREAIRDLLELSERSTAVVGPITWRREDLYGRGVPPRQ